MSDPQLEHLQSEWNEAKDRLYSRYKFANRANLVGILAMLVAVICFFARVSDVAFAMLAISVAAFYLAKNNDGLIETEKKEMDSIQISINRIRDRQR